jgi:tetratricopeptide (TPR) repeat protein
MRLFSHFLMFMLAIMTTPLIMAETGGAVPVPVGPAEIAAINTVEGDRAYLKRADLIQAKVALEMYEKSIEQYPNEVEPYWKASRAAWWIADHTTSSIEKIATFQKGIDLAKKALVLNPNSVEAHFWLGGNMGSFGEAKGVLKSLFLVKPIRKEMEDVIRLNPTFDGGAGYRVLGVVDYKVPGFAGGNKKRALENLNKALAIDSTSSFNHYYMAEYFFTVGNKAKASEHLAILQSLTPRSELDKPDVMMMQKKGEALAAKIKK